MMKKRDISIDFFKGILTILMIFSHILQFYSDTMFSKIVYIFVGIIAFSGFMFSFGYISYKTYIIKEMKKRTFFKKIIRQFLKILLAYYICGLSYIVLIKNDYSKILNVLLFREVPKYCEYLISFSIMYLLILIFKQIFNKINNKIILLLIIISLLMTQINYEYIDNIILGSIIGTSKYTCFPIVQYFCYFLFGMFLQKNRIIDNKKIYLISIICTLIFLFKHFFDIDFELRFPPSIYWIIGGFGFVYGLFLLCKKINENKFLVLVSKIGQNTLSYLVISNLIIFLFYKIISYYSFTLDLVIYRIIFYLFVFVLSFVLGYLYNYLLNKKKNNNL